VFMQLCIKLIIMEESTKKIFKPKFELVQECNALFQYIWLTLLRLYFKGQKSLEPPRKIIKCWWCVVQFETLPLTHWELGLKNCARTKQGIFYIIYQIAYVVNIQTSSRGMFISRKKGSVVLSYQFLVLYLSSTKHITWKILLT
jgi:hypothetical protein